MRLGEIENDESAYTRMCATTGLVILWIGNSLASGQTAAAKIPRMTDGKPNLNGIWESLSTANWDLQDHSAYAGPMWEMGAIVAVPAGQGVVKAG